MKIKFLLGLAGLSVFSFSYSCSVREALTGENRVLRVAGVDVAACSKGDDAVEVPPVPQRSRISEFGQGFLVGFLENAGFLFVGEHFVFTLPAFTSGCFVGRSRRWACAGNLGGFLAPLLILRIVRRVASSFSDDDQKGS